MIKKLTLSNYRALGEEVVIGLGPFTALVGLNGSGKSSIIDALGFIAAALKIGLSGAITSRHGYSAIRRWSADHPRDLTISIELDLATGPASYSFTLEGNRSEVYRVKHESAMVSSAEGTAHFSVELGKWAGPADLRPNTSGDSLVLQLVGGDRRFRPLVEALQGLAVYSIFPDVLRTPQKYEPRRPMDQHGANWTSILKDQPEDTWKPDLVAVLSRLAGDIEDLRIRSTAGYLVAELRHRSEARKPKWFGAAQESDGTLRVAGIVTALLQEPPLTLIAIEEPELTVHPGALPLLYDYIREAAKRSQVVVTTHSPDFLDLLSPAEVRVVTRTSDGTRVGPIREEQLGAIRDGLLSLGEVQRGEGLNAQPPLFDDQ